MRKEMEKTKWKIPKNTSRELDLILVLQGYGPWLWEEKKKQYKLIITSNHFLIVVLITPYFRAGN